MEAEEFECGLACGLTCRRRANVSDATAMTMANNEPATPRYAYDDHRLIDACARARRGL